MAIRYYTPSEDQLFGAFSVGDINSIIGNAGSAIGDVMKKGFSVNAQVAAPEIPTYIKYLVGGVLVLGALRLSRII